MKKIYLFFILLSVYSISSAQLTQVDSLFNIIKTSNNDSVKIHTVIKIPFGAQNGDTVFLYAKKLIEIGTEQKNDDLLAMGWSNLGYSFFKTDNLSKSLACNLTALRYAEKRNTPLILAMVFENLGLSLSKNNPSKSEYYFLKGIDIIKHNIPKGFYTVVFGNYARLLIKNNRIPEALNILHEFALLSRILNGIPENNSRYNEMLFEANAKLNQNDIAIGYGRTVLNYVNQSGLDYQRSRFFYSLGNFFFQVKMYDSCYHYLKQSFYLANKNKLLNISVDAADGLSKYFLHQLNKDSSIYYLTKWRLLNDSLISVNKATEIQGLSFEEQLREKEIAEQKSTDNLERNHNIQLAFIAVGILSVISIFLLLSNSFIVSHKVVGFLSVLVLLVVFEFINLLIHPFLEKITHHSPVLMLLGLVAIAALIIPLHHKLEHWATNKLVEKNKAIRLAQAKKTIEELEGEMKG